MENQVTYKSPESMGLPPGYRFFPNNKELLEYYLLKKINGESIPHNPIKDCDVYGEPMIWWNLFEETGMKTLYFYTKLNNREKGKRVARNTVFGTWSGEGNIPIYDDDDEEERDDSNERERNHIGSRSTFSFAKREGFEHDTKWTMHEYKLDGIHKTKQNKDKYVLCKINKVIKKRWATKDKMRRAAKNNSRQNIQDEDIVMSSTFGNSDWIETYYGQ